MTWPVSEIDDWISCNASSIVTIARNADIPIHILVWSYFCSPGRMVSFVCIRMPMTVGSMRVSYAGFARSAE